MPNLLLPDIGASFNQGFVRGQGQQFNRLAGQAIADPDNASAPLGLAAAINPGKALGIQQELQTSQDAKQKKLAGAANYLLSAYKTGNPQQVEGAYQSVRPYLNQLGQELGQGPASPNFTPDMLPHLYQIVGQAGGDTAINGALPGGVREFNAMAQNLSPEDRKRAERINLGLDARAVTGAAKTGMITGADGRERPFKFNPANGSYEVFDGQSFRPLDQTEASQIGGQAAVPQASAPAPAQPTPEQLMAQATQMANQGGPGANADQAQAWLQQQMAGQGRLPTPVNGQGALGVSRAPEDTAGAVQNAKNASDLQYLPAQENVKVNAAVQQAGGTTTAKGMAERQLEQPQAQASLSDASNNLDRLADTARRVMQHPGLNGITSWQANIPDRPGSDAANARAELEALKSQVGFSVLQAMRNASKTGGALGSVSDAEQGLLQSNLAALQQSQSPAAFRQNLQRIVDYTTQAKSRLGTAYNESYGGQGSAPAAHAPIDDLLSKYKVQ